MSAPLDCIRVVRVAGIVALATVLGCFDSDQKIAVASGTDASVTGYLPPPGPPPTSTTGEPEDTTTGPPPDATCRDAIECVQKCAKELEMSNLPEPDLSCFINCETGLNTDEALALLRLGGCAAEQCQMMGLCEPPPPPTGTDTSGTTGTGTGTGVVTDGGTVTDTGTTTGASASETGPLIDPCLNCIMTMMLDPQPPGCLEEGAKCT